MTDYSDYCACPTTESLAWRYGVDPINPNCIEHGQSVFAVTARETGTPDCGTCPCLEPSPSSCRCPCYGCKFHCGACWCGPCQLEQERTTA